MSPPESESAEAGRDRLSSHIVPNHASDSVAIFRTLYAMRGTRQTVHIPVHEFCDDVAETLGSQSGKILSATQWRENGGVSHRFLILHCITPEPVIPFWIRLDRRPYVSNRMNFGLVSSSVPNSDVVCKMAYTLPPWSSLNKPL